MVFLLIQTNLAKIGISKPQLQQAHPFNGKILIGTVVFGINAIVQFIFLVQDAEGFRGYTESSIVQVEKWSAIVYLFVMVKVTTVCGIIS